jgi:hypothetical protein
LVATPPGPRRELERGKTAMNESGKSDKPVVPAKSAKIRCWDFYQRYVEQMEGRGLAKENEDHVGNETDLIFHAGPAKQADRTLSRLEEGDPLD